MKAPYYLLRKAELEAVQKIENAVRKGKILLNYKLSFCPSLYLYGPAGCGKHMLCRYIAGRLNISVYDFTHKASTDILQDACGIMRMRGMRGIEPAMIILPNKEMAFNILSQSDVLNPLAIIVAIENMDSPKPTEDNRVRKFTAREYIRPFSEDEAQIFVKEYMKNVDVPVDDRTIYSIVTANDLNYEAEYIPQKLAKRCNDYAVEYHLSK